MPLSFGTGLPMRRLAIPPSGGAPGRPAEEDGGRKGTLGGGGIDLSPMVAFLRAAVAASTDMGLLGARLAN